MNPMRPSLKPQVYRLWYRGEEERLTAKVTQARLSKAMCPGERDEVIPLKVDSD